MRGFGEIAALCRIATPQIGLVTRVAEAHSDRVDGIDGVARAKAELIEALPADGVAILNADDHRVRAMSRLTSATCLLFGEADDADVRVRDVVLDELARPSFVVDTPWGSADVRLSISGRHMVMNAAAALACVGAVGGDVVGRRGSAVDRGLDGDAHAGRACGLGRDHPERLVQRQPDVDARRDRCARSTCRRPAASRLLGVMAEISDAAAEHLAIATLRGRTGRRGDRGRHRPVRRRAIGRCSGGLGLLSGDDAVLVKGQPRGRARKARRPPHSPLIRLDQRAREQPGHAARRALSSSWRSLKPWTLPVIVGTGCWSPEARWSPAAVEHRLWRHRRCDQDLDHRRTAPSTPTSSATRRRRCT